MSRRRKLPADCHAHEPCLSHKKGLGYSKIRVQHREILLPFTSTAGIFLEGLYLILGTQVFTDRSLGRVGLLPFARPLARVGSCHDGAVHGEPVDTSVGPRPVQRMEGFDLMQRLLGGVGHWN
jgi:hypothetical protein